MILLNCFCNALTSSTSTKISSNLKLKENKIFTCICGAHNRSMNLMKTSKPSKDPPSMIYEPTKQLLMENSKQAYQNMALKLTGFWIDKNQETFKYPYQKISSKIQKCNRK